MKTLPVFLLFVSACVNCTGATIASVEVMSLTGNQLPAISHVIDMKIVGDTLYFVYETPDGYGQRFLRRAIVDRKNNTLNVGSDMGKRDDGYYVSYMPYPYIADNGAIRVISQDDCEIYSVSNDKALVGTREYLMGVDSTVPFPISQYVQDVFTISPNKYVFIGREPNGGRQFAMSADMTSAKIDTIRQISISSELPTWMPNAGEMVYSGKNNRIAFAYKLHPIVEIFDIDGININSVRIGEDTFDPGTLDEADFDDLNVLHSVDLTYSQDYIYALYWGYKYSDAQSSSKIYKFDWDGNILSEFKLPFRAKNIVSYADNAIISWDGTAFSLIEL